jgi:mono/diheme cytochrome c family protein
MFAAISVCNDCHTPNFLMNGGKTTQKDWLIGGAAWTVGHDVSGQPAPLFSGNYCNSPIQHNSVTWDEVLGKLPLISV